MLLFDKETFKVTGMSCASCASNVESVLSKLDGIEEVSVNLSDSSAKISYNNKMVTPAQMNKVLAEVGYGLIENKDFTIEEDQVNHELAKIKNKFIWSAILTFPVLLISFFPLQIPFANVIMFALATPILFYFGKDFFINTFNQAIKGLSSMDTLVALGTGSAWLLSTFNAFFPFILKYQEQTSLFYFESASVIITLMLLGKYLEAKAKTHTTDSIKKFMGLRVKTAYVQRLGAEIELDTDQVAVGYILKVRPGEAIPVDGQIIEGNGIVDECMITGDKNLVEKKKGDNVIGATINTSGSFLMEAVNVGQSTLLSQIIKIVKEAQVSRAPIQRQVDKISLVFVPIVLLTACLTAVIWSVFGPETKTTFAFVTAITVLLIACPCALGLASPTAIMVGIGKSAENGILIRGAGSLETIQKISAIVLDKAGIITQGKPTVTDIILSGVNRNDDEDLLPIILGIEKKSEHILATAITDYLSFHKINPVKILEYTNIDGNNIKAIYKDQRYILGSPKWLMDQGVSIPDDLYLKINELSKQNKTLILVGCNDKATVLIGLRDNIKQSAYKAIKEIKKMGIEIHMLSADHEQTALMVALETGLDHFKGDVQSADKIHYIKSLQNKGHIVAMVGDGLNDSPALTEANVSISMCERTDFAMDHTDITIIKGDLSKIVSTIRLSKLTVKTIRQNLFWASIYNIIGIPLAAGILYPFSGFILNPIFAGAVMAFSSVSVITNSLRLKRIKI